MIRGALLILVFSLSVMGNFDPDCPSETASWSEINLGWEDVNSAFTERQELTHFVSQRENSMLDSLSSQYERLDWLAMAHAVGTSDWQAPVMAAEIAPQLAYLAYVNAQISLAQLVTHQIQWAAKKELNQLERVALFIEGRINERAVEILTSGRDKLDASELRVFIANAKRLPLSEQNFWVGSTREFVQSDSDIGVADASFRTFMRLSFSLDPQIHPWEGVAKEWPPLVIPSFSLQQLFLNIKFKQQAIQLVPRFGIERQEVIGTDIGFSRKGYYVPFPAIYDLQASDEYFLGMVFSSIKSFYHAYRGSQRTLPSYRKVLGRLHDLASKVRTKELGKFHLESEISVLDPELWLYWQTQWKKFELESGQMFLNGVVPSASDCLKYDFGDEPLKAHAHPVAVLIAYDVSKNPQTWVAMGFESHSLMALLGPKAYKKYEYFQKNNDL